MPQLPSYVNMLSKIVISQEVKIIEINLKNRHVIKQSHEIQNRKRALIAAVALIKQNMVII